VKLTGLETIPLGELPNLCLVQECVRAFHAGWHTERVTGLPVVERGTVRPAPGPGLGVELHPGLTGRAGARVRRTARGPGRPPRGRAPRVPGRTTAGAARRDPRQGRVPRGPAGAGAAAVTSRRIAEKD
jgi:hypothetical protein